MCYNENIMLVTVTTQITFSRVVPISNILFLCIYLGLSYLSDHLLPRFFIPKIDGPLFIIKQVYSRQE